MIIYGCWLQLVTARPTGVYLCVPAVMQMRWRFHAVIIAAYRQIGSRAQWLFQSIFRWDAAASSAAAFLKFEFDFIESIIRWAIQLPIRGWWAGLGRCHVISSCWMFRDFQRWRRCHGYRPCHYIISYSQRYKWGEMVLTVFSIFRAVSGQFQCNFSAIPVQFSSRFDEILEQFQCNFRAIPVQFQCNFQYNKRIVH